MFERREEAEREWEVVMMGRRRKEGWDLTTGGSWQQRLSGSSGGSWQLAAGKWQRADGLTPQPERLRTLLVQ